MLARRRLVGAHPRAEADGPPFPALGPLRGAAAARAERRHFDLTLAEAATQADALAESGDERALAELRSRWDEELEAAARSTDFRERATAFRAVGQFRFRTKTELLRRGLEDGSPAVRGSALLSLERLSRDHPGVANDVRPLLHELVTRDPVEAVRRLAVVALRNGSARPETLRILDALAANDDEPRELRDAAAKVAQALKRRSAR